MLTFYGSQPDLGLADVSLSIAPGERIALIGPQYKGVTPLIRILGCTLRPGKGEVLLDGVAPSADKLQFVPSDGGHHTEIVIHSFFERYHKGCELHTSECEEIINVLGLKDLVNELSDNGKSFRVRDVSSGEKWALAVASALFSGADIIVLENPKSRSPITLNFGSIWNITLMTRQ